MSIKWLALTIVIGTVIFSMLGIRLLRLMFPREMTLGNNVTIS